MSDDDFEYREIKVLVSKNEEMTISLRKDFADFVDGAKKYNYYNIDNFTKKCYQSAMEQGFTQEEFPRILEWWLNNSGRSEDNIPYKSLVDPSTMDEDDPWIDKVPKNYEGQHHFLTLEGLAQRTKK